MIDLDINSIPIEEVPRLILALSARLVAEPALATAKTRLAMMMTIG